MKWKSGHKISGNLHNRVRYVNNFSNAVFIMHFELKFWGCFKGGLQSDKFLFLCKNLFHSVIYASYLFALFCMLLVVCSAIFMCRGQQLIRIH